MCNMSKAKKPYPGLGPFVVVMDYGYGDWVAYAGATTAEKARARKRELSNWPSDKLAVVSNLPGDPKKTS